MECPHCSFHFQDNWKEQFFDRDRVRLGSPSRPSAHWRYRTAVCPSCKDVTIEVAIKTRGGYIALGWRQIYPVRVGRSRVPTAVPQDIAKDYVEACNVLPISAKASAALSRHCLQSMLHAAGYRAKDLSKEIDLLLDDADPGRAVTHRLRETVDAIRKLRNASARPIDDRTALLAVEVDPREAAWCLEVIEDLFEHFYVSPAAAKAQMDAHRPGER